MGKFAELMRSGRMKAHKTLRSAGEQLGVKLCYISEVELGNRPPLSHERIEILAKFYETDAGPLHEHAFRERGFLWVDLAKASRVQIEAMAGIARGLSDEQWREVNRIVNKKRQRATENG